jgi:hypothetical protein
MSWPAVLVHGKKVSSWVGGVERKTYDRRYWSRWHKGLVGYADYKPPTLKAKQKHAVKRLMRHQERRMLGRQMEHDNAQE